MPIYPIWLFLFAVIPCLLLLVWKYKTLRKYKKVIIFALIGTVVFSYPWDLIALHERIWYFTPADIFGIYIAGLPIEEWVFIFSETLLFAIITILLWERQKH